MSIDVDRPHARSALAKGGIQVWRLAYEEIDPGRILFGPQDSGQKILKILEGMVHEDDTLSEEDMYYICGLLGICRCADLLL